MNTRSYQLIFGLLSCCVVFIIALQAFWIRNFYHQETEAFDRSVYSALEKTANKLQERKSLQALKMTYIIVDGDTIAKTPSRNMRLDTKADVDVINMNSAHVSTHRIVSLKKDKKEFIKDSVIINGGPQNINIIMKGEKGKKPRILVNSTNKPQQVITYNKKEKTSTREIAGAHEETEEMGKLIDKMITEIRVIDTETENADTLSALIKRVLINKGLFLPFEFSVQKAGKALAQSKGFLNGLPAYKSDLSANKLISNNDFLLLQFPGRKNYVMAGMKGSLALSGIFSLIILGAFFFVLRLILDQKKLSEIKNDFINNMTHELKTPIATISLATDNLNNPIIRHNDEKFEDYIRILKEENRKLNSHVERVLQMALLDKGELTLDKKPVDVIALIHSAIAHHALQARQQRAVINFNPPHHKIIVDADIFHLQTVFNNLLDNAFKYASESCIIYIDLLVHHNEVIITFKDNGIGIDAHLHEKVFERFYRAQGGNLHDVKGFGLGLSYAKSIVEAHGGSIGLQSEKGKGSEFTIRLKTHG